MSVDSLQDTEIEAKDFKQRIKIQNVIEESQRVKRQRRRALDQLESGLISQQTANRMQRHAVMDLIVESKHLIQDTDETVEMQLKGYDEPIELSCYDYFWQNAPLGSVDLLGEGTHEFWGLQSIMPKKFGDPKRVTYTERSEDIVTGVSTQEYEIEYQVPWDVSWRAYVELRDFWAIHNLELEYDEGRPFNDWREEYEDGVYYGDHDDV